MARLFFLSNINEIKNDIITFNTDDSYHLKVLRVKIGSKIKCINSLNSKEYIVKIININPYKAIIEKESVLDINYNKKIYIIQSIPKLDKFELVIQKLSEINVYGIFPVYSENSNINNISNNKIIRWNKIAKESSIQSGRKDIIKIYKITNLKTLLDKISHEKGVMKIILNENETNHRLNEFINKNSFENIHSIYIIIGPEGGFSDKEINIITTKYKFESIVLKGNILRTETAPIVITSIIQYLLDNI